MITRGQAVQATLLTSFGALLLFGAVPLPGPFLAIGLVVVAVLVLARTLPAPWWLGAALFGVALTLLLRSPVQRWLDAVLVPSTPLIAGGFLLALGILQLADSSHDLQPDPTSEPTTF